MRVGFFELLVVCFLIFLLFGPEALPNIARQVGFFLKRINREIRDLDSGINEPVNKKSPEKPQVKNDHPS